MNQRPERVAVVTGGSSGIGLATVATFLETGFNVAFFGQNPDHVESARNRLVRRFGAHRILARCVDLALPKEISSFFREVEAHWQPVDTLVCNAGISPKGENGATPFLTLDLAEWNRVLAVNLTGTMLCCQAVLPAMLERGFGRIVLIGSIAGRTVPRVAGTAYVVSKAGLAGLCRSLLASCAGSGVTVNMIAPGCILTEMTGPADSETNRAALGRIPVGRLGDVGDIAAVTGFLASRDAGFINGAIVDVNGGEFAPL